MACAARSAGEDSRPGFKAFLGLKSCFSANWICRDVVDSRGNDSGAEGLIPEPEKTTGFGAPKFA